jgi:predicted nucleotidyltransferase
MNNSMNQLKGEQNSTIVRLIRNTIHDADPTAQIILYGSRARGDARSDSDWDVLILIEKAQTDLNDYSRLCYPVYYKGLDYGEEINATLYTQKEWNEAPPSLFKHNVMTEGIRL